MWTRLRDPLRLIACDDDVRSVQLSSSRTDNHVTVQRFEQTIGGRAYEIEVTLVSNRWRAQLRRGPGLPTAMMPFYGTTADEAALLLVQWLTLAHRRRAA